jgi:nuclear pore complex protein Nup85
MPGMLGAVGASSSLKANDPSSSSTPASGSANQGNFCGLFADDWATEEKISLFAETFTIFSSLQKIAADEANRQRTTSLQNRTASIGSLLPSVQTLQYYRRISGLYRDALKRYILTLEAAEAEEEADLELSQWLHTILHFLETIYIPADGRGAGVVGEEVLHWLNTFDFGESAKKETAC